MGDMADDIIDRWCHWEIEEHYNYLDNVWVTQDGNHINISEMGDFHLNNCIAMIRRRNGWREDYLPILESELERRSK